MSRERELLKQALESLNEAMFELNPEGWTGKKGTEKMRQLCISIDAELAKPEPEPPASNFACYLIDNCENEIVSEELIQIWLADMYSKEKYTSPPQQKPLSQELIIKMAINNSVLVYPKELMSFARAIEKAHGIGE